MPKFNIAVPHQHDRDFVVEKLKSFSKVIRDESPVELSNVTEAWDDDGNLKFAFTAMGMSISGDMVVDDTQVSVSGKMPLAAAMFRGAIESQISNKIRDILA